MPVAQVVAIVALARRPRLRAPILEIARRRRICILVISQSRFRPVFEAAPGRVIAILEVCRTPLFVCQVPSTNQDKSPLRRPLLPHFLGSVLGSIVWRRRLSLRPRPSWNEERQQNQATNCSASKIIPFQYVSEHPSPPSKV